MDCSGDSECVEEALNGLLVDIFLQCDTNSTLTATLKAKCYQHEINSEEENLVELFQKLKQRRIIEKDNVDFLKEVAEAGHNEDVKKRIEEFGEGKWRSHHDELNITYVRGSEYAFRWPETLGYGSNALAQVLLRFVQNEEHMNDREKSAFFIYCDGLIKSSLDFSFYLSDPFLLIQQLMGHGLIGPRNLDLLKRFFSLETVRKPKEIAILQCFEAGAFYKQVLDTYCGTFLNSTRETDEPWYIPWIETARLIRRVTKKSFKGTKRLHVIRNRLQHILESAGKDRLFSIVMEEACLDHSKHKKWQHILKILVISGEICCLPEPPWGEFTIAEMSKALGVFSDPNIVLQTVRVNTDFLLNYSNCSETKYSWEKPRLVFFLAEVKAEVLRSHVNCAGVQPVALRRKNRYPLLVPVSRPLEHLSGYLPHWMLCRNIICKIFACDISEQHVSLNQSYNFITSLSVS